MVQGYFLLIAAIPLCIYMKADFFNAVIYMFILFLMGFRSKGSGAVKNIGMLMSLISPALLFMSAPVWIMGTYAAIVGVCVHMHSRRYVLGLIYIIVSFFFNTLITGFKCRVKYVKWKSLCSYQNGILCRQISFIYFLI